MAEEMTRTDIHVGSTAQSHIFKGKVGDFSEGTLAAPHGDALARLSVAPLGQFGG